MCADLPNETVAQRGDHGSWHLKNAHNRTTDLPWHVRDAGMHKLPAFLLLGNSEVEQPRRSPEKVISSLVPLQELEKNV